MKIIAHRGDSESFPENTLIAFKEAITKGADAIELDVHLSLDNKIIVHHDYNLKYPTKGEGYIPQVHSSYIRSLDAGSWFSEKYEGERIPFLAEVFETFGKNIDYEIELKGFTKNFIQEVMNLVAKHDLLSHIEFTSPHAYALSYLKKLHPQAKIGMFASAIPAWMNKELWEDIQINVALLNDFRVIHMPFSMISESFIKNIHDSNMLVHVANCDTKKEIENLYKMGIDQFSTNMLNLLSNEDDFKKK